MDWSDRTHDRDLSRGSREQEDETGISVTTLPTITFLRKIMLHGVGYLLLAEITRPAQRVTCC